jgi:hypothetical protein
MEYPHWLMIAGAVLVAFGFVGFAFSQQKRKRITGTPKCAK